MSYKNLTGPDLSRPHAIIEKDGDIELFTGELHRVNSLDELNGLQKTVRRDVVFVTPYSLIQGERGFEAVTTGVESILVLVVDDIQRFTREQVADVLGEANASAEVRVVGDIRPTVAGSDFTHRVAHVQQDEIAQGEASQVVISRAFHGRLKSSHEDASIPHACFSRLLDQQGQYMTVLFSDENERALVGATPELHLEITADGKVTMRPIAGTFRKGDLEAAVRNYFSGLFEFLDNKKEQNELLQVLDEVMKMLAEISVGGTISGPFLRETSSVIHTEYALTGERVEGQNVFDALRFTLNAPTLMGSPLQNAARLIAQYEKVSRGYYGGVIGVSRFNEELGEADSLDSAILIRTAVVHPDGQFFIRAGAGVVEGSDPESEAAETLAKANGFLSSFTGARRGEGAHDVGEVSRSSQVPRGEQSSYLSSPSLDHEALEENLAARNNHLSRFHFERQSGLQPEKQLEGKRIVILHNEDNFSFVLRDMVSHLGAEVMVVDSLAEDAVNEMSGADVVIIGPGPGDINDATNPRMVKLREITHATLDSHLPVLGVCLGNQALAVALGMPVTVQGRPTQGQQRVVNLFGEEQHLGFYNSFSAEDVNTPAGIETCVDTSIDGKERVMALRSSKDSKRRMIGTQFHPESIMSENGYELLKSYLVELVGENQGSQRMELAVAE